MGAEKPILVFAPVNSYISDYAKKHGFALVLNELNPIKLRQYIYKLLDDSSLKCKLVKNARKIKNKHTASVVSTKLQKAMFE